MKTKTMKRLAAAVAAITMMSAVPMSAVKYVSANDDVKHNLTVQDSDSKGRTYKAYQIFKGDYDSEAKTLSNITWNTNLINGANLISALKGSSVDNVKTAFASANTVEDVANVLKGWNESANKAELAEFSRLAILNLVNADSTGEEVTAGTAKNLPEGYYLIVDKTTGSVASFSRGLLALNGDITVSPKTTAPTIVKKVNNGSDWVDANTEKIGELVEYKLTSEVPDMTGYNEYFFVINDKLSQGLELKPDSFEVKIETLSDSLTNNSDSGDAMYAKTSGYYVETYDAEYTPSGGSEIEYPNAFRLVFNNMKGLQQYAGNTITITYKAYLGGNGGRISDLVSYSTTGSSANTNTVNLIYSNNPNKTQNGTPADNKGTDNTDDDTPAKPYEPPMSDNPGGGTPTPDDPTDDAPDTDEPSDKTTDDTVVTYTAAIELFKTQENATTPLEGAGFTLFSHSDLAAEHKVLGQFSSDSDGKIYFKGLEPGTYYLAETNTPSGFNTAKTLELTLTASATEGSCTWTKSGTDEASFIPDTDTAYYKVNVINNKGTTLPGTGGIGTTIFYVSGGTLILGAVVVMITKKRMSLKEDK